MAINKKLLTNTEKTIAVIEEYEKFTERMEAKYAVRIKYNVDSIDSTNRNTFKSTPRRSQNQRRR